MSYLIIVLSVLNNQIRVLTLTKHVLRWREQELIYHGNMNKVIETNVSKVEHHSRVQSLLLSENKEFKALEAQNQH